MISTRYADHFRLVAARLEKVGKVLKQHDIQLGLEFLGSYGNRRVSRNSGQGNKGFITPQHPLLMAFRI